MAFHEAGHAVAAWSLNLLVGDIDICGIGEGNGGAQIGCAAHLVLVDQLAALAAGKEAERVFQSPPPIHAGDGDRVMAINLVLKLHPGIALDEVEMYLTAGHARARELLIEHQNMVTRLAELLVKTRQVVAADFLGLMNA
jgi:ATP-dependent Zn protease